MKRRSKETWSHHPKSIAVSRYTLNGEYIDSFDSIGLAFDQIRLETGLDQPRLCTSVKRCCEGDAHHSYGYKWSFKGESIPRCHRRRNVRGPIWAWNKKSNQVKSWSCVAEASEEIIGDRVKNSSVKQSLESPLERKRSVHREWYFVRNEDDVSLIVPAVNDGSHMFTDEMKQSQRERNRYKMVSVIATSVTDPEVVYQFESLRSAAFNITGDKRTVANISKALQLSCSGRKTQRYGYYWTSPE